jgi:hypothetical protein
MKISDELAKLRILVSEFEALEPGLNRASATNYDKGALGYYIHTGDSWMPTRRQGTVSGKAARTDSETLLRVHRGKTR